MYIKFNEIEENQDLYRNKDDFWKEFETKILICNLKHFIFYKDVCKMYKLNNDLQLKIVEHQDLYRKKDGFDFFKTKSSYILI